MTFAKTIIYLGSVRNKTEFKNLFAGRVVSAKQEFYEVLARYETIYPMR